jgi:protein-tyrosine phosphatase
MSAEALQELGGSRGGFRSRPFVPALAAEAHLVLTMTERQRRSVLESAALGLRRTFTLTEAAALLPLADVAGLASMAPGHRPAELGRRLHDARARRPAPRWSDIGDPLGQRPSAHRDSAQQIAAALRPLADVLFAASPSLPAATPQRLHGRTARPVHR